MLNTRLIGAVALIAGLGGSHLATGQSLPLTNKGGINPDSWVCGTMSSNNL
jgi:hypothetical protein